MNAKYKYINKEGNECLFFRINATKKDHKQDLKKIAKQIDLKKGLIIFKGKGA